MERVKKTQKLSDEDMTNIIQTLLQHLKNGQLTRGVMKNMADTHNISSKRVQRLWGEAKKQIQDGKPIALRNKMKDKAYGREKIKISVDEVSGVSMTKRRIVRALAKAISRSKSTVHMLMQSGQIKAHTNPIKPHLTEENKVRRLQFCLSKLLASTLTHNEPKFESFYDYVHIDEKWFYMTQTTQRVYVHAQEEMNLHRPIQSKKFITKIMFLTASARPQHSNSGEVTFDRKIGIFTFIFKEVAVRNSRNRPRGTMVTKPILSVTKEVYKTFLITRVILAIKVKWPRDGRKRIFIQQYNARPHIPGTGPDFPIVAKSDGFVIELTNQPPNNPDPNVLDLGYFRAIQVMEVNGATTTTR